MKAYRYRIEPDEKQVEFLAKAKQFGCCRLVYNWALDLKTKAWQKEQKGLSISEISRRMTLLKKEKEWFSEVASQPLQQSLIYLDKGFTGFFKKKTDYLRFKSKWRKQAATVSLYTSSPADRSNSGSMGPSFWNSHNVSKDASFPGSLLISDSGGRAQGNNAGFRNSPSSNSVRILVQYQENATFGDNNESRPPHFHRAG